ncbi:L-seryl-tRNA(Sec) selenium transferase [Anoxybacter fermentans]|uniref:L-seryl-tRNA(Sec) selenium transferase n=1 Tax=Anoxybacter fermentans TaxID=1323375 RepID=A0A3Q9HQP8_9FIRM|nr:L-seryl-tRNA(Sec) selenium transferase [Anoxybacter fermentans]AZR73213.1 L-seryl-tRNA(Sec) selenium transferase [Anoxybacter fermentans]
MKQEYLRKIPAVNRLLQTTEIQNILTEYPHDLVVDLINQVLDKKRRDILEETTDPEKLDLSIEGLAREAKEAILAYMAPRLKKVINATGTVLHTNLGRAVLSEKAADALAQIARTYSNLEYDLKEGKRGSRYTLVTDLLCRLTGAEDALVVNNNAAAVLLVLSTLAKGKEVIISRGELVEIGGSFRMHEVMKISGCTLVEVGSTNKTHLYDYENAITSETGLLVKVHTSNYQIVGFSKSVENKELVELAHKYQIPVFEDLGSGVLINLEKYGIAHEPTVQEAVSHGVDLVSFSGDKLLGGPQAGIIVGKKEYIQRLKRNHLLRALRVDKFTLAALEVTLKHYLREEEAMNEIPTLRMLKLTADVIKKRVEKFAQRLKETLNEVEIRVVEGRSMVGGGSLPLEEIPTWLVGVKFNRISTTDAEIQLRQGEVPVICRIQDDELLFDLRTVFPDQEDEILEALLKVNR